MAIFLAEIKTFKRSRGQSSVNAAAYRCGGIFKDNRTGLVHNYSRKAGVLSVLTAAPLTAPSWVTNPERLWNEAEVLERKNGCVARELLIALPSELSLTEGVELAKSIAQFLVDRYAVATNTAVHLPDPKGDQRNVHAHIMFTTREIGPAGFGRKTRILDDRKTGSAEFEAIRQRVAEITNEHLEAAGVTARVDHRSLKKQSLDAEQRGDLVTAMKLAREPTRHEGQLNTRARRSRAHTDTTLWNDLVHLENRAAIEDVIDGGQRSTIVASSPLKDGHAQALADRQRENAVGGSLPLTRGARRPRPGPLRRAATHVGRISRATGAGASVLNAQAEAMRDTIQVEGQLAQEYQRMLEDVANDLGSRGQAVVAYARLRRLAADDVRALALHAANPKCPKLLREVLRAEEQLEHTKKLENRRRKRYVHAMMRTARVQREHREQSVQTPRSKRQWAELRRQQQAELNAAKKNERRAERLVQHESIYSTRARQRAAEERIAEIETKRRAQYPLPSDQPAAKSKHVAGSDLWSTRPRHEVDVSNSAGPQAQIERRERAAESSRSRPRL